MIADTFGLWIPQERPRLCTMGSMRVLCSSPATLSTTPPASYASRPSAPQSSRFGPTLNSHVERHIDIYTDRYLLYMYYI